MKNINLTPKEKKALEKRGFLVKRIVTLIQVLKSIYSTILLVSFLGGIGYIFLEVTYVTYFMLSIMSMLSIVTLYQYILSSSIFYSNHGMIGFGSSITKENLVSKIKQIGFFGHIIITCWKYIDFNRSPILYLHSSQRNIGIRGIFIISVSILGILNGTTHFYNYFMESQIITGEDYMLFGLLYLIYGLGISTILCFMSLVINKLIHKIHPLYAFGNLGEKIQKLTPKIESQSQIIQSGFHKEQNFSKLHSGFETLSLTFSRIIELVLKLETIEKRANKGNLFDSEKYINSLRSDITVPLVELKKFLERQREELLQSQEELTRVMTGGSSSFQGNRELGNKREDILLEELNRNIEKLEGMLYKLA